MASAIPAKEKVQWMGRREAVGQGGNRVASEAGRIRLRGEAQAHAWLSEASNVGVDRG
jgi:hypothetical protein